jgi:hypothetical protein
MAKNQVEVITSLERRRRWSSVEKLLVVTSLEPGAVVSALARGIGASLSHVEAEPEPSASDAGRVTAAGLARTAASTISNRELSIAS